MFTCKRQTLAIAWTVTAVSFTAPLFSRAWAQHPPAAAGTGARHTMQHPMFRLSMGKWGLTGMGQVFPVVTALAPDDREDYPLRATEAYLTQPTLMTHLASPGHYLVLRSTFNLEGVTLESGELNPGAWGEGFIDKRHPHTLFHELMLSLNLWNLRGNDVSLSAGKGFAPYGTDDPMSRPSLKYPTNHHLSQILERWTLNGVWRRKGWSVEAGVFGGTEPTGPYDMSNIDDFGNSWSGRLIRRWTSGERGAGAWEASASVADVTEAHEDHDGREETTRLLNGALRYEGPTRSGDLYSLTELSRSRSGSGEEYFSFLTEARYDLDGHQPHLRLEYATRPEYTRTDDSIFRYDHHAEAVGASRWLVVTAAYARQLTGYPLSFRPFLEVQYQRVRPERGDASPGEFPGITSFLALSVGVRLFLGGGPMRMGRYGILDSMSDAH